MSVWKMGTVMKIESKTDRWISTIGIMADNRTDFEVRIETDYGKKRKNAPPSADSDQDTIHVNART